MVGTPSRGLMGDAGNAQMAAIHLRVTGQIVMSSTHTLFRPAEEKIPSQGRRNGCSAVIFCPDPSAEVIHTSKTASSNTGRCSRLTGSLDPRWDVGSPFLCNPGIICSKHLQCHAMPGTRSRGIAAVIASVTGTKVLRGPMRAASSRCASVKSLAVHGSATSLAALEDMSAPQT